MVNLVYLASATTGLPLTPLHPDAVMAAVILAQDRPLKPAIPIAPQQRNMKTRLSALILLTALSTPSQRLSAAPLDTAFTYQGRLAEGTNAASGLYDLRFALYDALAGGNLVAGPLTNSSIPLTSGLFTVALDFGASVFNGDTRWLEIGVRSNGSPEGFTLLAPRQALAPVPYALQALSAGSTSAGLSISQQPSTNQVSVSDDLLINATNNGAGTWTAMRATVGSVLAPVYELAWPFLRKLLSFRRLLADMAMP